MEIYILHKIYDDVNAQEDIEYGLCVDDSYDEIFGYYTDRNECQKDYQMLKDIQEKKTAEHDKCCNCPIQKLNLTKRKFKNHCQKVYDYCDKYNIMFDGNNCWCSNQTKWDYTYEEIYGIETIRTKD